MVYYATIFVYGIYDDYIAPASAVQNVGGGVLRGGGKNAFTVGLLSDFYRRYKKAHIVYII